MLSLDVATAKTLHISLKIGLEGLRAHEKGTLREKQHLPSSGGKPTEGCLVTMLFAVSP